MNEPLESTQNNDQYIDQNVLPDRQIKRYLWIKRVSVFALLTILFACIGAVILLEIRPSYGAQVANLIRNRFGPEAVAQIEAVVFQFQDTVKYWQYQSGIKQAEAPWESDALPLEMTSAAQSLIEGRSPTPELVNDWAPTATVTETPAPTVQPDELQDQLPEVETSPTPTPTPYVWQLTHLVPYGSMEGEGVWQPYLYDQDGNVVAERTFLQPDPERPYSIVAVVAFDLSKTRLNFVLGFEEPALPDGPRGDGLIPEEDRQMDVLLAAFNGGFRVANGHFGAMANGIEALPPINELATVGIYRDGEVRIGSWGEDINESPDLIAWRQNCPPIIRDGEISPKVYSDSIIDWGGSISNEIVTRRSSIGLDRESGTLYYFAGPGLSMPVLADAMRTAGVHQGMLLDINNFWVHFTAIHSEEGELVAEPLLPNDMHDQIDRYLGPFAADFFYVTLLQEPEP